MLVGREPQLEELSALWTNARVGPLRLILLEGEAGSGKTTLMEEFAERVRGTDESVTIVSSKCHGVAGDSEVPHAPFIEILLEIVKPRRRRLPAKRVTRMIADLAPDWISIIPVVGGPIAALGKTAQLLGRELSRTDAEEAFHHRMLQYLELVENLQAGTPLLICLDDLHWADNASLNMLSFWADHALPRNCMFIGTFRPTDIVAETSETTHPLRRLISKLQRYQQVEIIAVPSLSQQDVEHYLHAGGYRFHSRFVEELVRKSGGNPLFLTEYIRLLHENGKIANKDGQYILSEGVPDPDVPLTVKSVVQQRLDLLNQDLRRVLSYASAQGHRFASRVLASLLESKELELLGKLALLEKVYAIIRELERQHLILKVGTEYQFAHAFFQEVLYGELGSGQRRYLHHAIGEMLEELYGEMSQRYAADLAVHFGQGANFEKATHYCLVAAEQALGILALENSLNWADKALQYIEGINDKQDRIENQLRAYAIQAHSSYLQADLRQVVLTCEKVEQLGIEDKYPSIAAEFLYWRARVAGSRGDRELEISSAKKALELLGNDSQNRLLHGRLLLRMARITHDMDLVESAISIGQQSDLPNLVAEGLKRKSWIQHHILGEPEEALMSAHLALELAEANSNLADIPNCHRRVAEIHRSLGHFDQAIRHSYASVDVARRIGMPKKLHHALANLAISLWHGGNRLEDCTDAILEAVEVTRRYLFPMDQEVFAYWFRILFSQGYWKQAEETLSFYEFTSSFKQRGIWPMYTRKGHLALAQGFYSVAEEWYQAALREIVDNEYDANRVSVFLGFAMIGAGNLDGAEVKLRSLRPYYFRASDLGNRIRHARILRANAEIGVARNQGDRSILLLREAAVAVPKGTIVDDWPENEAIQLLLGKLLLLTGEVDAGMSALLPAHEQLTKWNHFLAVESAQLLGAALRSLGRDADANRYMEEGDQRAGTLEA